MEPTQKALQFLMDEMSRKERADLSHATENLPGWKVSKVKFPDGYSYTMRSFPRRPRSSSDIHFSSEGWLPASEIAILKASKRDTLSATWLRMECFFIEEYLGTVINVRGPGSPWPWKAKVDIDSDDIHFCALKLFHKCWEQSNASSMG